MAASSTSSALVSLRLKVSSAALQRKSSFLASAVSLLISAVSLPVVAFESVSFLFCMQRQIVRTGHDMQLVWCAFI